MGVLNEDIKTLAFPVLQYPHHFNAMEFFYHSIYSIPPIVGSRYANTFLRYFKKYFQVISICIVQKRTVFTVYSFTVFKMVLLNTAFRDLRNNQISELQKPYHCLDTISHLLAFVPHFSESV